MFNDLERSNFEMHNLILRIIPAVEGMLNLCPQSDLWIDPLKRYAEALNKFPYGTQNLALILEHRKQLIAPLNQVIIIGKAVVKTMPREVQQNMYNFIADQEGLLQILKG